MSLHLEFEPHSWYMGFAIKKAYRPMNRPTYKYVWEAYTENGNTYSVDTLEAYSLTKLQKRIRAYHLKAHNGYGERIAKRRLNSVRQSLDAQSVSYCELAELETLVGYIDSSDTQLLEAAGVQEGAE